MNTLESLSTSTLASNTQIDVLRFLLSLIGTAVLSYLLGLLFERKGRTLSNRHGFALNFVTLGLTTMMIITVVKSSLALSLGLVGALSIVRFRTAIKEPEELTYIFLTIAIGLGFGADQWLITTVAFAVIATIAWFRPRGENASSNLFLTVRAEGEKKPTLETISAALKESSAGLSLKRFDEVNGSLEASYLIRFVDHAQLVRAKNAVEKQGERIQVSFVDHEGVF